MIKTEKEIAEKQIVNNIMTTKQVLNESTLDDIEKMGGVGGLLLQCKNNLTLSLKAYGLNRWATSIDKIPVENTEGFDDFAKKVQQMALKCM